MNHETLREEELLRMMRFTKSVIDSNVTNNPVTMILLSEYLNEKASTEIQTFCERTLKQLLSLEERYQNGY